MALTYPADLDKNCHVGLSDVAMVAEQWLATPTGPCGDWPYAHIDLDDSCRIDLGDLAAIANEWMFCNDPQNPVDCPPNW